MRCPDDEGWSTIEDFTDDTQFECLHCGVTSREWLYTATTRGRHLVLLAEEKYGDIEQAVRLRNVRTTGMRIGAQP